MKNFLIKKITLLFAIVFCLFLPLQIKAATLYIDPVNKSVGPNDVFEVKVKIGVDSRDECINAAKIGLGFSADILEVKDFSIGESIFSLWIDKPDRDSLEKINKEGKIYFTGGVPGGYCGRIPGDPGDSNILGMIIFSVKKPVVFHNTDIYFLPDSEVLLNDGKGSLAKIEIQNMSLKIDENIIEESNIWKEKMAEDITPPEPFVIEINRTPNAFDNKYFIIFSTIDKQTGIDHYEILEEGAQEVLESLKEDNFFVAWIKKILKIKKSVISFKKGVSPYLLKDQNLKSVIMVKAVDNAGNERIVEYQNNALDELKNPKKDYKFIYIIITAIVIFLVILFILVKTKKKKIDTDKDLNIDIS